jgi:amino acid adenylation domain-containing protein
MVMVESPGVLSRQVGQTYGRPVAISEWWALGTPEGLVREVQVCVEGDGIIDPAALTGAVDVASQACPGARLVRKGQQWVDSGQAPPVRVVEAAGFGRSRLDSQLLRRQLNTERKPTCEVLLVPGTPTTVVFRSHPMDGRGVMFWQQQVFRALRGEAPEEALSTQGYDETRAEVAATFGIDLPLRAPRMPRLEWRSVLGPLPRGPRRSAWHRRTIDGIHLGVTAKIARLITAYGDGQATGGAGRVSVPVDLRQFLPQLRSTGAVTGMLMFDIQEDDDWTDVDARLLTTLRELKFLGSAGDPTVLTMPITFIREMQRWHDNLARANPDYIRTRRLESSIVNISHLGAVELADLSADGFEATSVYSLGSVCFMPEINIMESRGRTEVTVAWRDGPGVGGRIEAMLDRIEEELSPRAHRVWDGNNTGRPAPAATLTSLFAEQVARTPDAVAIADGDADGDGDVSYAELDRRSAGIAAALQDLGIGRGDRVGLVAGRSPATIAAVWGILRSGAAYLPIDASYPDARVTQILTAASAPVCLLEQPSGDRNLLPPCCAGISLDDLPGSAPAGWQDADGQPGDLACVIYTSGSTGEPKGVEIEHRSLVNYVRWVTREADIDAATRMPLIASISFDMAGCAIYLPLLNGGTVLPVREVNAATLREAIETGGANTLAITPSHLDLINMAGVRRSAMRVVMTAGELLRRTTALRARELFGPDCRILCQWGPTETTIVNTSHEFDPEADTDPGVPFGRPMDNNTVYLLDSRGRFVAPGEAGEACVGGVQVARGYLGRPDLTRQRFVRLADGTRVYRTGDIVRLLPNGELSFICRADDQVKVAGHRIEPAEIAQVLEDHPEVRQATVVARSRPNRPDKELCAYVVTDGTAPAALKDFLAERLPRYMVPTAIVSVPAIPRNPNGKTDISKLPDPFSPVTGVPAAEAPATGRDEVADAVAEIWARTLQLEPQLIDEQTDFRVLGGNSILLLLMIDEVSRTVAADARAEFMAELGQIIREPTLGRVSSIARQALATVKVLV